MIISVLRGGLQLVALLLLLGAAWELRTAWRWSIAPALGIGEAPLRADGEVISSSSVGGRLRSGANRARRANAIETSVRFNDAEGRLRVVHSLGFFHAQTRGSRVPVAYLLAPLAGQAPPAPNIPAEAEGEALFFDVLYSRSLVYAGLLATVCVLLAGIQFFRAPMEGAAEALEARGAQTSEPDRGRPLEDYGRAASLEEVERAERDRARGAEMVEILKEGARALDAEDEDPSTRKR